MRLALAIIICKFLYIIGSRIGKGSSLPGRVALTICPRALKLIGLPEIVVAVTGSNGKTTTTEMIARALTENGMSVGWNREGANQTEGIATLLLRSAGLNGTVKRDAIVMECDERSAWQTFKSVRPSVLVVTNLCRDQLTRNGHPEFIMDCLGKAVEAASGNNDGGGAGTKLVLNADDPYVTALAAKQTRNAESPSNDCLYFGVSEEALEAGTATSGPVSALHTGGMYDDGAYCPVCKSKMAYGYRVAAHMGGYRCDACGHRRPEPDMEICGIALDSGEVKFSGGLTARLTFPGLTGAYNMAAALAAATAAGINAEDAALALDGFELTGGRTPRFTVCGREGLLLISKHENSLSYDQSLARILERRRPCDVIVMVDSISRKYYTSETSWLWDIDFDKLADENVKNIILTGRYINELAARFAMTAVAPEKISCVADPAGLRERLGRIPGGELYALTCFADKGKLLKALGARGGSEQRP